MFEKRNILVVEDERSEAENISKLLESLDIVVTLASTIEDAIRFISQKAFDFLLTDLHIETTVGVEEPDGLVVIRVAREQQPSITVVANSSDPRTEIWNKAHAVGAHHFIRKPFSNADEIVIAFGLARERKVFLTESKKASRPQKVLGCWKKYAEGYPYGIVIGERELRIARGIAKTPDASFVISGETGTGKEEIARLIHRLRQERGGPVPFVAVNCATIMGSLTESLLFGHRKGAFTGADQSADGFIKEADGGILFLDEIHSLEIPTQQKLLRVLNDGTYYRLGDTKLYRSQFQLLAASTRDLDDEVDAGRFLIDIRTRMMGIEIKLPPLRDRKQDIPALTALYLSKKGVELNDAIFSELVEFLRTYHWSGNIRQLFKALDAWILTCEFDEIPLTVASFPAFKGMKTQSSIDQTSVKVGRFDFSRAFREDFELDWLMSEIERDIISEAIKRHSTIVDCCKALGVNRSTFDSKRRRLGLL